MRKYWKTEGGSNRNNSNKKKPWVEEAKKRGTNFLALTVFGYRRRRFLLPLLLLHTHTQKKRISVLRMWLYMAALGIH